MTKRLFPKINLVLNPESRLGKVVHLLKRLMAKFLVMFAVLAIFRDIRGRIGFSDDPAPFSINASFYVEVVALALILLAFEKMEEYDKRVANPDQ